jgi:heme/copper-type cytochrome/quinol oxidase subunit 4
VLGILGPVMIGGGAMSTTRILILLGGITVVLPLFLFMVAVAHNPNVSGSVISMIFGGIVFTIFLIGAIFEIKRLIDKP